MRVKLTNPQTRLQRRMLKKYGDVWFLFGSSPNAPGHVIVGTHPTIRQSQDFGVVSTHWPVRDTEPINE